MVYNMALAILACFVGGALWAGLLQAVWLVYRQTPHCRNAAIGKVWRVRFALQLAFWAGVGACLGMAICANALMLNAAFWHLPIGGPLPPLFAAFGLAGIACGLHYYNSPAKAWPKPMAKAKFNRPRRKA